MNMLNRIGHTIDMIGVSFIMIVIGLAIFGIISIFMGNRQYQYEQERRRKEVQKLFEKANRIKEESKSWSRDVKLVYVNEWLEEYEEIRGTGLQTVIMVIIDDELEYFRVNEEVLLDLYHYIMDDIDT